MSSEIRKLDRLVAGQEILYGGNRVAVVSAELASAFTAGDELRVVERGGVLLHIPEAEAGIASEAVDRAEQAFRAMGGIADDQISRFYEEFAQRLEADA